MLCGFLYGMASASARRCRLTKAVLVQNEVAKTATWMLSTDLVCLYPMPEKLGSTRLSTDFLAVSNGICTKRKTARFWLLLFENEVNNNSQTWPLSFLGRYAILIHLKPLWKSLLHHLACLPLALGASNIAHTAEWSEYTSTSCPYKHAWKCVTAHTTASVSWRSSFQQVTRFYLNRPQGVAFH